jgi:hypothetical protein
VSEFAIALAEDAGYVLSCAAASERLEQNVDDMIGL